MKPHVVERPAFLFRTPASHVIAGGSSSGKSTLLFHLLKHQAELFEHPAAGIVYCYSLEQPLYQKMREEIPGIVFHQNPPAKADIEGWVTMYGKEHFLLVLDDLATEVAGSDLVQSLYVKASHHWNFSVLNLTQNLFLQGKHSRTNSLNSHYFFLTRNLRDMAQIRTFGGQLFPDDAPAFLAVYKDAMKRETGEDVPPYLLTVCHPFGDEKYRLLTSILPTEGDTIVYELTPKKGAMEKDIVSFRG